MGRAGEAGDAFAAYSYGRMRLNGEGGPVDVDCAETYLRRAAKTGYVPAIRALAAFYSQGGLVRPTCAKPPTGIASWPNREMFRPSSRWAVSRPKASASP